MPKSHSHSSSSEALLAVPSPIPPKTSIEATIPSASDLLYLDLHGDLGIHQSKAEAELANRPAPMEAAPVAAPIEQAWHLLTVLIRIGRPVLPSELAWRCTFPAAPVPDLVELLCRIPRSPLLLADDGFVTASETAIAALGEFVVSSVARFVPRVRIRVAGERTGCGNVEFTYFRKRKARGFEISLPSVKRRLFYPSREALEGSTRDEGMHQLSVGRTKRASPKVHSSVAGVLHNNYLANDMSSMRYTSSILNEASICPPSLNSCSVVLSSCSGGSIDHVCTEANETRKVSKQGGAIIVRKGLTRLLSDKSSSLNLEMKNNLKENPCGGLQTRVTEIGTSITEKAMGRPFEGNFSQMAIQVALGNETSMPMPTQAAIKLYFPSTAATINSHAAGQMENMRVSGASCDERENTSTRICALAMGSLEPALKVKTGTFQRLQRKSLEKPKIMDQLASTMQLRSLPAAIVNKKVCNSPSNEETKREEIDSSMKPKLKKSHNQNVPTEEIRVDAFAKTPKNSEPKLLPNFESFLIEEEEGSGGYGIVYRAQRKTDGKIFAIKCPRANAQLHHVNNELKMLERFGGRNFVIKFEGSFRNKDSVCFVLEHVEHDRPEALKKEIDVFGLQWYGFCMFKALASLHKQGIVHRDIKPGNFLFSCKVNKGYLIDFNLANDLHHKFCRNSKSGTNLSLNISQSLCVKPTSSTLPREVATCSDLDVAIDLKKPPIKNLKKKSNKGHLDAFCHINDRNKLGNQVAADVSVVTSAKDATSTRTSAERLKQPMPCKGRKELINFVHEALQSPNRKAVTVPSSQRKRVAAPMGKVNRRLLILSPMPLHSGGNAVAGSGMSNTRGNGKPKREGPCVGTKGFRAPEVLFKSYHQGCKLDIWSAGVTLLYLIIGRTPFSGDPEQNIKDIAKLRGSEDLWEVAKLHSCESSLPTELFDVQSLQSMELRDWCALNTRRPEFLEVIPESLLDLVDKCLTVNPRTRISAEDALMHDFFTPCHERLRKHRLLRRTASLDSSTPTS